MPGGFLELFGKPPRESACECERSQQHDARAGAQPGQRPGARPTPSTTRTTASPSWSPPRRTTPRSSRSCILAILCRLPTKAELQLGLQALKDGEKIYRTAGRRGQEASGRPRRLRENASTLVSRSGRTSVKHTIPPAWTPLDIVKCRFQGRRDADQADGRLDPGQRQEPGAGHLHHHGADEAERHHGHSPGSAARCEACRRRVQAGRPTATSCSTSSRCRSRRRARRRRKPIALKNAQADFAQASFPIGNAIDNNPATGWAIAPQFGKTHTAYFPLATPIIAADRRDADGHDVAASSARSTTSAGSVCR